MSIKNSALKKEKEEEEFYITQYWHTTKPQ